MKKRLLITSIVMMLVVAVALSTATYAWFSTNKTVTATGMTVNATTSASLVIGVASDLTDGKLAASYVGATATTTDATAHNLTPVTWDSNAFKTISNGDAVSATTGHASSDTLAAVTTPTNGTHYNDYVFYLASSAQAFTPATLTFAVTATGTQTYKDAITVQFFVGVASVSDATSFLTSVNVKTGTSSATAYTTAIPEKTSGSTPVVMRVYIDGALNDTDGNAYVRSNSLPTDSTGISVTITAA